MFFTIHMLFRILVPFSADLKHSKGLYFDYSFLDYSMEYKFHRQYPKHIRYQSAQCIPIARYNML